MLRDKKVETSTRMLNSFGAFQPNNTNCSAPGNTCKYKRNATRNLTAPPPSLRSPPPPSPSLQSPPPPSPSLQSPPPPSLRSPPKPSPPLLSPSPLPSLRSSSPRSSSDVRQAISPIQTVQPRNPVRPPLQPPPLSPPIRHNNPSLSPVLLGLLIGAAVILVFIIVMVVYIFKRKLRSGNPLTFRWKDKNENIKEFLKNHDLHTPKKYSYWEIKKMTNSFSNKLGEGGFGGVYKGKLLDDRLVAVKVLSDSKSNGEDFINEVSSISRTSHVNIVSLLGYCYRPKRVLIYEYMPNGSLDKLIYSKGSSSAYCQLEWNMLYQIAIGIARGLEYLHRGCNTRILHFDIKPHNILLDENFCAKISDFGLAKLCERNQSTVSMLGARGTRGYIAPEVCSNHFGRVSYKSDVYSYGMMVLEMVGRRKNMDLEVSQASKIYFPHYIYKRIEVGHDLHLDGVKNEEDEEIAKKMILVSLWCIQTNPSDRPSMTGVIEMLEGGLQSLVLPPNPFVSSPTASP